MISEITDLYEVLEALLIKENITFEQVQKAKESKTKTNGAFTKQLCLVYVNDNDESIHQ